jgi:hypothetical protein
MSGSRSVQAIMRGHAGSNIFAGVIKLIATKEYHVTKTEIRRKVFRILLTNSEPWQADPVEALPTA